MVDTALPPITVASVLIEAGDFMSVELSVGKVTAWPPPAILVLWPSSATTTPLALKAMAPSPSTPGTTAALTRTPGLIPAIVRSTRWEQGQFGS